MSGFSTLSSTGSKAPLNVKKAERRLTSLVLPLERIQAIEQFVAEWRQRDRLIKHGIPPRSTLLLHGPSGNGKTAICEAIAWEMRLPFGIVQVSEVVDSCLGETGKNLHNLFRWINENAAVVLFDECDSLTIRRGQENSAASQEMSRAVNQILTALDAKDLQSVCLFATNLPESLDPAFLRRMGMRLHIEAPTRIGKGELIDRLRHRWKFLDDGDWVEEALRAPSFSECEQIVMGRARELVLAGQAN